MSIPDFCSLASHSAESQIAERQNTIIIPLFTTVALLFDAKQARHRVPSPDRQVSGRLGGQTRTTSRAQSGTQPCPLPRSLSQASFPSSRLPAQKVPAQKVQSQPALSLPTWTPPPKIFVLNLLPSPLKLTPLKLTLHPPEAEEEEDLIAAINQARTECDLSSLVLDPLLSATARAHSREMCDRHYFNHRSPTDGQQTPMDRYLAARQSAGTGRPRRAALGENIFFTSQSDGEDSVKLAHQSLMDSPDHRANILEPRFTKVGVGFYADPNGQLWVTEMFLKDN